jgi:hypothetical protein
MRGHINSSDLSTASRTVGRRKRVYISSSFAAREDRSESLMGLRQDLKSRGARLGVEVVLGEEDPAVQAAVECDDAAGILEGCARLMADSDAFFGMIFERHGTGVVLQQSPIEIRASISFFEAELLEAAITRKPIAVVQANDLKPSAQLRDFLRLVGSCLGHRIVEVDRKSLPYTFEDFCKSLHDRPTDDNGSLFDVVSIGRVRASIAQEVESPALSFLGNSLREDGTGLPDDDVIRAALRKVEEASASDGRTLGQLERLSYLWAALRELARGSATARLHEFGDEMQRVLKLWNSSAAWYGIHGSHPMGCLAALNELSHVRTSLGNSALPLGERSSAYYSIAAKVDSKANARRFFSLSLRLAQRGLKYESVDPSNLLQMTASSQARLAMLGEPWRYFRALSDFRRSYHWRRRNGATDAAIGEAMGAYAYVLFKLPFRKGEALEMAREASELIRTGTDGVDSGFYIRSERKRAELLWSANHRDEALVVIKNALRLARESQAFDQARQFERLIADWQSVT